MSWWLYFDSMSCWPAAIMIDWPHLTYDSDEMNRMRLQYMRYAHQSYIRAVVRVCLDFLQEIRFCCLYKHFRYGVMLWWATIFGVLYGYTLKNFFMFLRCIFLLVRWYDHRYWIFLWLILFDRKVGISS